MYECSHMLCVFGECECEWVKQTMEVHIIMEKSEQQKWKYYMTSCRSPLEVIQSRRRDQDGAATIFKVM